MPNLQSCAHPPSEQHSQIVLPPRFELGLPPWKGGDLPLVYRSIKPNSYAVWYYVWLITEHSHQSVQITLTFDKITALLWNYPMVCHLSLCIRRSRHLRGSGFLILPTNTNPFSPAVIYVPCYFTSYSRNGVISKEDVCPFSSSHSNIVCSSFKLLFELFSKIDNICSTWFIRIINDYIVHFYLCN